MEFKGTPGPWTIAPKTVTYRCVPDAQTAQQMLLRGIPFEFDALSVGTAKNGSAAIVPLDESCIENALLIACATRLLEELIQAEKTITEIQNTMSGPFFQNQLDGIRAAIKKATGG